MSLPEWDAGVGGEEREADGETTTSSAASSRCEEGVGDEGGRETSFLASRRSPIWVHPTSGYFNAETYFRQTHPFARPRQRHPNNGLQFHAAPYGASSYINSFPRRGIGPRQQTYMPASSYPDQSSVYIHSRPLPHQDFGYRCDPKPFNPFPRPSRPISVVPEDEPAQTAVTSEGTDEGSSEPESTQRPIDHPVGTTPIFHPLPGMFNSLPRPLPFPVSSSRNKELPTLALFQNCSLESKVVGDYADSHQELSLMLALPGLSAHQAPLLSLQQSGDILQTINNPLVVLKVGRLSRKLVPNPALLKPTDDVGTLALWLSPTSDVRLFWHSFLKGPTTDSTRAVEEQISQLLRNQGEGSPYKELFSHVELSEELAWVAAESDTVDGGSGIRLEMMEHDPSGRSFKLTRKKGQNRQKMELASKLATEEERTGQQRTEETQKLRQLLAQCMSEDPEEEDSYFFWIAESSVSEGLQMLNMMQHRLDHLPTLASESGVPEKKLQELYAWFSKGQKAVSSDSTLSNEIASWIDLRSGSSVPSQLFSNSCPANVPNWAESQPSTSDNTQPTTTENTIREGCALSATANFLVADKKWGLTHLATASVMVAVGVESTGFFYDEAKAHLDLSQCAHELAKKRAEAGASAEAERLGRIRLEELVAVKSLKEMRSHKTEVRPIGYSRRTDIPQSTQPQPSCSSQSEELIQQQQRTFRQTPFDHSNRPPHMGTYWGNAGANGSACNRLHVLSGQSIQGNSVLHHSHVHANSDVMTHHMPDYFRQHVHYSGPTDLPPSAYQMWKHDRGEAGGNTQVLAPNPPYDYPSWSTMNPNAFHPYPWPYDSGPPPIYQPVFTPPQTPPPFFPRHLPPQLPFLQMAHLQSQPRQGPNLELVRIAEEAREKVARKQMERVRAGPSGSNLVAPNVDINQVHDDVTYAWHEAAHQLGTLYRNRSLNVARMPDGDTVSENRTHAETPRNATADDADKM